MTTPGTAADWTMRLWVVAALVTAPIAADAQTHYRCVQKGKPTIFQGEPCPLTAKTASAINYVADPNARPYQPLTTPGRERQQTASARLHQIPISTNTSACEAARAHRDAVVGANTQRGDVDVRRRLNDAVARACY